MDFKEIVHENYTVEIEAPELYVDNESRKRSGHMTHAMAEFAPGCFIDFNSNCSALKWNGHSTYGWVEYRISKDAGKTYSDVYKLPYSVDSFLDGIYTISVEKAVATDDGTIVALCLRNDAAAGCEPWDTPTAVTSSDGGATWSEPIVVSPYKGRIYDAVYHDGAIYVLQFCNEHFLGSNWEHRYRIYKSTDNGKSFEELCMIPFDTERRGYGAMLFDAAGTLHVYAYNEAKECEMDHAISTDGGRRWIVCEPCHLEKGIRNPQVALIDGVYILHGRSAAAEGFVLYSSENATDWDEGCMLIRDKHAAAFYSNNLNLTDEKGNFLLVQYSDQYRFACVNVMHMKVRIKK
ncbi:MAG: exo-alpha-sialidase [Clostridia bacterium]|nr:exo-alpha-sialidase [Clostridia bacterium]